MLTCHKNGLLKIIGIRIKKLKLNLFWSSVPVTATTKEIILNKHPVYKNSKYILTKQTPDKIQNIHFVFEPQPPPHPHVLYGVSIISIFAEMFSLISNDKMKVMQ